MGSIRCPIPRERTDRYLVFPGCESVGVKVREGRFEIKALKGAAEIVRYPSSVSGRTECWVKWSHSSSVIDPWLQSLQQERADWIDVTKARWLRTFTYDGEQVAELQRNVPPALGGTVELTHITALNEAWWSLAIEAPGAPHQVRETLRVVAEFFFLHNSPPISLNATHSCSYPAWLATLSEHG